MSQRIIGIVPARAGSVGIPGKNAKPLAGYPLVSWSIIPALEACDIVIVTTNDPEVLALGWCADRLVVHRRSDMLATARTPDLPVVVDAYHQIEQEPDDVLVLLRPTAPLRLASDIREVVRLLAASGADSVRSVVPARDHPQKAYLQIASEGSGSTFWFRLMPATGSHRANHPRQWLSPAWKAAGFVDAVRADVLIGLESLEGDLIVGWPTPLNRAMDIDTETEWQLAETQIAAERWNPGRVA